MGRSVAHHTTAKDCGKVIYGCIKLLTFLSRCLGGTSTLACSSLNIPNWVMDVPNNPHLSSGEAFPIADQIQDNLVRSGVDIAACRYTIEEKKFVSIVSVHP